MEEHWGSAASDPVLAALWQGLANADGFPFPRGACEKPVVQGQVPRRGTRFPCGSAEPTPPAGCAPNREASRVDPYVREGRIFRRDALCASGRYSRAQARVWPDHPKVNARPVAQWRHARLKPMVSLWACGARPSKMRHSQRRWAYGPGSESTPGAVFPGGALCAPTAQGRANTGAFRSTASVREKPGA